MVWSGQTQTGNAIYGRYLSADGQWQDAEFVIHEEISSAAITHTLYNPYVSIDQNYNVHVVWTGQHEGTSSGIYYSRGTYIPEIPNTPPYISIHSPTDGMTLSPGSPVSLSAVATDNEDGDLSHAVVWTSNIDGTIISGGSLSEGSHLITATVTDSEGLSSSANVNLEIIAPPLLLTASSSRFLFFWHQVSLQWHNAEGSRVNHLRNDITHEISNTGRYQSILGRGTHRFRICELAPSERCSKEVSVTF